MKSQVGQNDVFTISRADACVFHVRLVTCHFIPPETLQAVSNWQKKNSLHGQCELKVNVDGCFDETH